MEGLAHLLSLKVMRVSRPTLASAWEPFYSSSSARSTASVLSLQGKTQLGGHPKMLRDLTHATDMLTLQSSFGTILLGETFSSCLCINNEASVDIHGVSLIVEMQTVTSKMVLAEFGGDSCQLDVGGSLENVVHHEIKELGQHVLACTVGYRLPPNTRNSAGITAPVADQNVQTFRKFYKFVVTNPLSVKTKVHMPRSPSALFSSAEKNKVFLGVHIQNMAQGPLWFERMRFECVEGWKVDDVNVAESGEKEGKESTLANSTALMQPQDTRQYIYILQPTSPPSFPIPPEPGSSIPFGRLDISWRSSFGEPGRLLTSVLSRRIPLLQSLNQPPASALPSYLKRSATPSNSPSRPRSPQSTQARSGTPPPVQRPGSPFRNRAQAGAARPQSPDPQSSNPALSTDIPSNVKVDLLMRHIDRETITVEKPFSIKCSLIVSAAAPPKHLKRRRLLTLAVQHVQPPRVLVSPVLASFHETSSFHKPFPPSSTHSRVQPDPVTDHHSVLQALPRQDDSAGEHSDSVYSEIPLLPAPFAEGIDEIKFAGSTGVVFLGSSTVDLDPIELLPIEGHKDKVENDSDDAREGDDEYERVLTVRDFELSYLPIRKGFSTFGGLRVLLLEDKLVNEDGTTSNETDENGDGSTQRVVAQILEEWSVIGEIWVKA